MCLIVNGSQTHPKRAKEDIKCMKVVVKSFEDPDNPTFHPIFVNPNFQYTIGKVAKDRTPQSSSPGSDGIDIGLHTFKTDVNGWKRLAKYFETARRFGTFDQWKRLAKYFETDRRFGTFDQEWGSVKTEAAVLECVIPKGTLHYEGTAACILSDEEEKGYVSTKLIPLREVPRSEWENFEE